MIKIELSEKKMNEPDMVCISFQDENGVEQTQITNQKHFAVDQNFTESGIALIEMNDE